MTSTDVEITAPFEDTCVVTKVKVGSVIWTGVEVVVDEGEEIGVMGLSVEEVVEVVEKEEGVSMGEGAVVGVVVVVEEGAGVVELLVVAGGKGVEMIVDEVAGGGEGAGVVVVGGGGAGVVVVGGAEDVGRDNDSVGLNIL